MSTTAAYRRLSEWKHQLAEVREAMEHCPGDVDLAAKARRLLNLIEDAEDHIDEENDYRPDSQFGVGA
jgi:hypothetical protein